MIKIDKVKKTFRHPVPTEVLRSVSLEIPRGESVAIMGESGEGKTTLLYLIGGLESFTSGSIIIDGIPVQKCSRSSLLNDKIGFIFQNFHLLEDYSTIENVLMPAYIGRKNISHKSEAYARVEELLNFVGLSHRKDYPVKLLSGGERQRVAIARALCNDPEIVLADEPSGNLDHMTSRNIHELLLRCVDKFQKTLVVVTHDEELAGLCNKKYRLQDGRI